MNATFLYVEACKCMLSSSDDSSSNWNDLFQLLPKLRQALSCRVCRGLLVEPFGSESCEHYVCRGCLRKKRSLNPGCRWCLNMDLLVADKQTRVLLACYQKLCEFIANSGAVGHLRSQNGEYHAILAVIHEASTSPIAMEDCLKDQTLAPGLSEINTDVQPATKISSGKSNDKMADKPRDCVSRLPAEAITPLPKRKIIQLLKEIDGNEDQKPKRKKKKHFKGTIYNYNKKKKLQKKMLSMDKEPENIVCQQFTETIQTIENDQDSNEEVQVVDEIDEKPLFVETDLSTQAIPGKLRGRSCRCGVASMGLSRKCIGKRCPCYTSNQPCEHCSCCNCANPLNNNNGKSSSVIENVSEVKNFAVSVS